MNHSNTTMSIQEFIIKKIQNKEWAEGERIWTESEICDHLQVSRVAVREAVAFLCSINVLVRKQGSGTYVRPANERSLLGQQLFRITPQEVISLLQLRQILDSASVGLYVENAVDEDIQQLEASYYNMIQHRDDNDQFNHYANEFHTLISEGTKNPFISKISKFLDSYLEQHQQVLESSTGKDIGIEYHYKILRYVKERNVEFATLFMRYHIGLSIERFRESLAPQKSKKSQ